MGRISRTSGAVEGRSTWFAMCILTSPSECFPLLPLSLTLLVTWLKCQNHYLEVTEFCWYWGFPCGSVGKESACSARDLGSILGLGRSPGEGRGYSGLENSMDYSPGVAKSWTRLRNFHFYFLLVLTNFIGISMYFLSLVTLLPIE